MMVNNLLHFAADIARTHAILMSWDDLDERADRREHDSRESEDERRDDRQRAEDLKRERQ